MFSEKTYIERKNILRSKLKSGVALFLGNFEAPKNYKDNTYAYRQDSTFLYYFGLNIPGLAAIIDCDSGEEIIFGNDFSVDDMVWMGPQKPLKKLSEKIGINNTRPLDQLKTFIRSTQKNGRVIHFLPPYRGENKIWLNEITNIPLDVISENVSNELIKSVIEQRVIKSPEEISEIESALEITYEMYIAAMEKIKPGIYEREIAGYIEGLALSKGSGVSFPIIFSIHGETLHNHHHDNLMRDGDIAVLDSGAESLRFYASDITRTIPVNGKFSNRQKEIYNIVLDAQLSAISAIKTGAIYKEIHLLAAKIITEGLIDVRLMKGNPDDAVANGAHALFFPHGLGHIMGLDVHDMENLGENNIGYNENIKRSEQFGLAYLRFGKALEEGCVMTVEPGCYFIPQLFEKWKSENKFTDYINYDVVEKYLDFGGIRIEDDVLVTSNGAKVLGKKIPKTTDEIEEVCNR